MSNLISEAQDLSNSGKYEEAIPLWEKAANALPNSYAKINSLCWKAWCYHHLDRFDLAEKELIKVHTLMTLPPFNFPFMQIEDRVWQDYAVTSFIIAVAQGDVFLSNTFSKSVNNEPLKQRLDEIQKNRLYLETCWVLNL